MKVGTGVAGDSPIPALPEFDPQCRYDDPKTLATCVEKFKNITSFSAEPFMPELGEEESK